MVIATAGRQEIDAAWTRPGERAEAVGEIRGEPFRILRGTGGDHLVTYADHALFHVSAPADRILCAPADSDDPRWLRELLDTACG